MTRITAILISTISMFQILSAASIGVSLASQELPSMELASARSMPFGDREVFLPDDSDLFGGPYFALPPA